MGNHYSKSTLRKCPIKESFPSRIMSVNSETSQFPQNFYLPLGESLVTEATSPPLTSAVRRKPIFTESMAPPIIKGR